MSNRDSSSRSIVASSLAILWLSCLLGCSDNSSGVNQGTGGKPSGGTTATGGTVGGSGGAVSTGGMTATGGTVKATGGTTPATGGVTAVTGGVTARTGGVTVVNTGGTSTATGGTTVGAGGSRTGGTANTGGTMVSTGGTTVGTGGSAPDAGQAQDSGTGDAASGGRGGADASTTGTGGSTATGTKSAGCGKTITRQDAKTQKTMSVGGTTRYYLLYTPTTYDPETPLPLVFVLHGMDMNNWWAANDGSGFKMIEASANKAIIVYPQGSGDAPGTTSKWGGIKSNWGDAANGNDMQFIDSLLTDLQTNYCVNTKRIFVTGFSMGGMMTESLICAKSKVFRAGAPVAGWGPGGFGGMNNPSCSDATAMLPVMITQGSSDGTVTPAMGQASRDFWVKRNTCTNTTSPVSVTGSGATCVGYQGCKEGTAVNYCTHSGGHNVPGNAGGYIWAFFNSYN